MFHYDVMECLMNTKAKTKNICGSCNPTYPNFNPPPLPHDPKTCSWNIHVLLFQYVLSSPQVFLLLQIYIILSLKLSQEFQIMHSNSHYTGLYPL